MKRNISINVCVMFSLSQNRLYKKSMHLASVLQPHAAYYIDMVPPLGMLDNPMNAVTTRFVRMSTNKFKCPIHLVRVSFRVDDVISASYITSLNVNAYI